MQLSEFKAWFEGFTETLEGVPNKKQWTRIKEKIAMIDGTPFVLTPYYSRPWWNPGWIYTGGVGVGTSVFTTCNNTLGYNSANAVANTTAAVSYDPSTDLTGTITLSTMPLRELGREEFLAS